MKDELTEQDSAEVARVVRRELARRRISRQTLADEARLSLSTLEKALSGRRPFTFSTLVRLEQALGVPLQASGAASQAPEGLGAYSRPAVAWLEGVWLTLRPSFDHPGAIHAYLTKIAWDEQAGALGFSEAARQDAAFSQTGTVSLPNQSGHVYLLTNSLGQYRLAILSRPTIRGELYGLLATLRAGPGSSLAPAATPLALVPLGRNQEEPPVGLIGADQAAYRAYRAHLERIEGEGFGRFFGLG